MLYKNVYRYAYMNLAATNEEKVMNLKTSKDRYMEGL